MNPKIHENDEELNNNTLCDFFTFNNVHLTKVIKCYDGDTIHCIFKHDGKYQKFKVRLLGYDSCEMKQSKKLESHIRDALKLKAKLAKEKLEELLLNKNVYLFCQGQDKYGRILGIIKLNLDCEKSINDIMIEEGFGYKYEGKTKKSTDEQFKIIK
jgi:endonuclease YncB( thermonuclease family)